MAWSQIFPCPIQLLSPNNLKHQCVFSTVTLGSELNLTSQKPFQELQALPEAML